MSGIHTYRRLRSLFASIVRQLASRQCTKKLQVKLPEPTIKDIRVTLDKLAVRITDTPRTIRGDETIKPTLGFWRYELTAFKLARSVHTS